MRVSFFLITVCGSLLGGLSVASAAEKPNIVFLLADDLGYGDLRGTGHPDARTPAVDRLAKEGTLFRNFYAAGATCCPSRTGFMTGRFPAGFAETGSILESVASQLPRGPATRELETVPASSWTGGTV
jgi:arylsulfatase A-like enzyme